MTWLIPNWSRAKGPAFWIYCIKERLQYELDKDNCCSMLHKFLEWVRGDLTRWLTPWLKNARSLHYFCIEYNGTKLLDHNAMSFFIRSRDENQYYFRGRIKLNGKVEITMSQWLDVDGKPNNLFFNFVTNALSEDEPKEASLVEKKKILFDKVILTKKQLKSAEHEMMLWPEFGWDLSSINIERIIEEIKPKSILDFRKDLEQAVNDKWFPKNANKPWYELDEEDENRFFEILASLSVDSVRDLLKIV